MDYLRSTQANYRLVDLSTWERAGHYQFFSGYADPFFELTIEVECGGVLRRCEVQGISKTFALWHGIIQVANEVEAFRYRIESEGPVLYEAVHLSPTVLRDDGTFTIGFVPYRRDLDEFSSIAHEMVAEARTTSGFTLDNDTRRTDLIHFSTVPWFRFTSLSNARSGDATSSEPKIVIGRFGPGATGKVTIPVSISAHHGFVDGYHVGLFVDRLHEIWA